MNQSVFYCKSWFRLKKQPIELWSVDVAYKKHLNGAPYTVLIGSQERPTCFIEVIRDKQMVGVGFLDSLQREYLMYQFHLFNENSLFLSMAVHREFKGDTDCVSSGTTYLFKEDGHTVIREENIDPHSLEESETVTDVSGNYDLFPEFGHYESLIRIER